MSLASLIQQLTESHLTTGPDGKPVRRAPLLLELQDAVVPRKDGSAGSGTPLPINTDAVDLEMRIRREARDDHQAMRGWDYRGPIRDLLASYLDESHEILPDAEWDTYLQRVMLDWIDAITALVQPTKPRRKLHVPCPACGLRVHGDEHQACLTANCWDADEKMIPPGDWDVRCEACGASWDGETLKYLIAAITQHAA